MIWIHPEAFLGLAAAIIFFAFIARADRLRQKRIDGVFSAEMRERLFKRESSLLKNVRLAFLALAIVAFICVLAGPRYGKEEESHKTLGRDVFVLFDVSDSMLAEDVAPNRLTVAKLDVEDLLDSVVGDRIGLVAFAGSAQVEIPLTTDYEFFRELLRKVDTGTVRLGGTAIGDAIRLALKRFGAEPERKRLIVLITDGEDHDSLPLAAAENAAEMNVPIITVAIGSPEGAKIPVFNINGERVGYKTFDGRDALSKPDVATLKEIAKISGGRYFYADSRLDLSKVYKASIEAQNRAEIEENSRVVLKDRYQPFLAVAILAFIVYYFFPTRIRAMSRHASVSVTSLLMMGIIALTSSSAVNADAQENAEPANDVKILRSSEQTQKPRKESKRQTINAYNDAAARLSEDGGDLAGFEATMETLADSEVAEVAGRAAFNLGAMRIARARDDAKAMLEPLEDESSNNVDDGHEDALADDSDSNAETAPKDLVEEYNKARSERLRLRNDVGATAANAEKNLFNSRKSKKLSVEAQRNAEAVAKWKKEFKDSERQREIQLRADALRNPEDRLRWLDREMDSAVSALRTKNDFVPDADFYRSLDERKQDAIDLQYDVDDVAGALCDALRNPSSQAPLGIPIPTPQNADSGLPAPQQPSDAEGAEKILQAQDAFKRCQEEASNKLDEYAPNEALTAFRKAQTQLTPFHDVPARYDALLSELLQKEQTNSAGMTGEKQDAFDAARIDDYRWSRESLLLSVEELTRKANQILASAPESAEAPELPVFDLADAEEAEPDVADDAPEVDSFDEESDEIEFDENLPAARPAAPHSNKSPEERLAESAKIAIQYEEELGAAVEKARDLAAAESASNGASQELADLQKRIVEILEEIARPLQDENQQNQDPNQQNQNQNQKQNQDQNQNSDQNQNDQNSSDQNQENQSQDSQSQDSSKDQNQNSDKQDSDEKESDSQEQLPDEMDEPEKPEDQKSDDSQKAEDEQDQNQTSVEVDESKPENKKKAQGPEKTEEQKKAEELARRVARRQKDAEPQRNAVKQALKKREKAGKDW